MKNSEKYKTIEERVLAYTNYRAICCATSRDFLGEFAWLELEYDEADYIRNCPFCSGEAKVSQPEGVIRCLRCGAQTKAFNNIGMVIAAWNKRSQ
jgi:hypothetical protein